MQVTQWLRPGPFHVNAAIALPVHFSVAQLLSFTVALRLSCGTLPLTRYAVRLPQLHLAIHVVRYHQQRLSCSPQHSQQLRMTSSYAVAESQRPAGQPLQAARSLAGQGVYHPLITVAEACSR